MTRRREYNFPCICSQCNTPFKGYTIRDKYCSDSCYKLGISLDQKERVRKKRLATVGHRVCKFCKKNIDHKPQYSKYCSMSCNRVGYYQFNKVRLLREEKKRRKANTQYSQRSKDRYLQKKIKKFGHRFCLLCSCNIDKTHANKQWCSIGCEKAYLQEQKRIRLLGRKCLFCSADISHMLVTAKFCSRKCWMDKNNSVYYWENRDILIKKKKEKRALPEEKAKNRAYKKWYEKYKRSTDEVYKLKAHIRSTMFSSFYRKGFKKDSKTEKILGCSFLEFKAHIEGLLPKGKTLKDLGMFGYHIDHKVPLAVAKTKEQVLELCHYTNLQPLWWRDNLSKSSKIL